MEHGQSLMGGQFTLAELVFTPVSSWNYLIGGFNPPEKYESQIGSSSQLLENIKDVPNHQPVMVVVVHHRKK